MDLTLSGALRDLMAHLEQTEPLQFSGQAVPVQVLRDANYMPLPASGLPTLGVKDDGFLPHYAKAETLESGRLLLVLYKDILPDPEGQDAQELIAQDGLLDLAAQLAQRFEPETAWPESFIEFVLESQSGSEAGIQVEPGSSSEHIIARVVQRWSYWRVKE